MPKALALRAVQRADQPLSATELLEKSRKRSVYLQRLYKNLAFVRRLASFSRTHDYRYPSREREMNIEREAAYAR